MKNDMNESQIEAMIASPPEREELVVQLFIKNGGQWGEIFRDEGAYFMELYLGDSSTLRLSVDHLLNVIQGAKQTLSERLENE
jgi:hypothetical protein